jgi:hypothetical protein
MLGGAGTPGGGGGGGEATGEAQGGSVTGTQALGHPTPTPRGSVYACSLPKCVSPCTPTAKQSPPPPLLPRYRSLLWRVPGGAGAGVHAPRGGLLPGARAAADGLPGGAVQGSGWGGGLQGAWRARRHLKKRAQSIRANRCKPLRSGRQPGTSLGLRLAGVPPNGAGGGGAPDWRLDGGQRRRRRGAGQAVGGGAGAGGGGHRGGLHSGHRWEERQGLRSVWGLGGGWGGGGGGARALRAAIAARVCRPPWDSASHSMPCLGCADGAATGPALLFVCFPRRSF